MTTPTRPSLSEAPQSMPDIPDPGTPECAAPTPLPTEPARSAEQQDSAGRQEPAAIPETTDRSRPPASKRSQQPATTAASEPAATATTQKISISTNTAIGLLGGLITLFGGVIVALLAHTLNTTTNQISSLNNRITDVETKLSDDIAALDTKLSDDIATLETKLSDDIATLETKLSDDIAALAKQQAETDKTLSVLIAVLNARNEVEAAKTHEITSTATP